MSVTSRRAVDRLARRAQGKPPSPELHADLADALAELTEEVDAAAADPRPDVRVGTALGLADLLDSLTRIVGHRLTPVERADNAALTAAVRSGQRLT